MVLKMGNCSVEATALFDTGNLIESGLAVSAAFAHQNKLPYTAAPSNIGTARKGATLAVLGHTEGVRLEVHGQPLGESLRAMIIEDLSS